MKIAVILFNLATEAGAPRLLLSFAQALKRQGHEVVIFTAEYDPKCFPELTRGLDIREIKGPAPFVSTLGARTVLGKGLQRIARYRLAGEIARRIFAAMEPDFDVVNCHTDFSYRVGALYKRRHPEAKFIWTMHDSPFDFNPKRRFLENLLARASYAVEEAVERRFFMGADLVVTLDRRNCDIARGFGLPAEVVAGGVDFEAFYAPARPAPEGKRVRLLSVGSLGPYRRFEDTVGAAAILRRRGYDARVLLACEDFWGNKDYRREFERFIENSGVKEYVDARFQGIPEKEFPAAYRASDVYVYATNIRIWGMGPLEAMAAGLPAVICRASSNAEVFADGQNALFSDASRPDQIAGCVERLLADPGFYKKIAEGGQKFVHENLTWGKYAERFIRAATRR